MTQRQESEARERLKGAINLLIETLNLIRDSYVHTPTGIEVSFDKAEKLEDKIRKFLKAPT